LAEVFGRPRERDANQPPARVENLDQQIGQLKVEVRVTWLKKSFRGQAWSVEWKRTRIEPAHSPIPMRRPCALIGLNPSTLHEQPKQEAPFNERRMRWLDEPSLQTPCDGVEPRRLHLNRGLASEGRRINAKRVRRECVV
jgi:hypothetical protein